MVYVRFSDEPIERTVSWGHSKTGQEVNIDLDGKGGLVGFEFIDAEGAAIDGVEIEPPSRQLSFWRRLLKALIDG